MSLTLKDILREHKPEIIFVCEIKMKHVQIIDMRKNIGFDNRFNISRSVMGDGLAMLWNSKVDVNITSYSNHHINVVIYGANEENLRCIRIDDHSQIKQ